MCCSRWDTDNSETVISPAKNERVVGRIGDMGEADNLIQLTWPASEMHISKLLVKFMNCVDFNALLNRHLNIPKFHDGALQLDLFETLRLKEDRHVLENLYDTSCLRRL